MTVSELMEKVGRVAEAERKAVERFFAAADRHSISARKGNVIVYIEDKHDYVCALKSIIASVVEFNVIPVIGSDVGQRTIRQKSGYIKCVVIDLPVDSAAKDGGQGISFLRWMKESYPEIPVIMVTTTTEAQSLIRSRYPGVDIHIKTSESIDTLAEVIANNITSVSGTRG